MRDQSFIYQMALFNKAGGTFLERTTESENHAPRLTQNDMLIT